MAHRELELTLLSARDLKSVNLFTRMDVYAVVSISADPMTRQSTPTDTSGGRNPSWNATLRFNVPPSAAAASGRGWLHVLLRSERALGDRDIGEVVVPLSELLAGADGPGAQPPQLASYQVHTVHRGEPRGVLNVSYRLGSIVAPVERADGKPPVFGHPAPQQPFKPQNPQQPYEYSPADNAYLAPPPRYEYSPPPSDYQQPPPTQPSKPQNPQQLYEYSPPDNAYLAPPPRYEYSPPPSDYQQPPPKQPSKPQNPQQPYEYSPPDIAYQAPPPRYQYSPPPSYYQQPPPKQPSKPQNPPSQTPYQYSPPHNSYHRLPLPRHDEALPSPEHGKNNGHEPNQVYMGPHTQIIFNSGGSPTPWSNTMPQAQVKEDRPTKPKQYYAPTQTNTIPQAKEDGPTKPEPYYFPTTRSNSIPAKEEDGPTKPKAYYAPTQPNNAIPTKEDGSKPKPYYAPAQPKANLGKTDYYDQNWLKASPKNPDQSTRTQHGIKVSEQQAHTQSKTDVPGKTDHSTRNQQEAQQQQDYKQVGDISSRKANSIQVESTQSNVRHPSKAADSTRPKEANATNQSNSTPSGKADHHQSVPKSALQQYERVHSLQTAAAR